MQGRTVALAAASVMVTVCCGGAAANDPADGLAVPGPCYVLSLPKTAKNRLVDRIELQQIQVQTKDGKPAEAPRVRIGIQPKGGDDLIPSDLSAPCTRNGRALACELRCEDEGKSEVRGRFRVEPAGQSAVRLIIETPPTLNACTPGETPVALASALTGKAFTLRRAGASDCFH